MNLLSLGHGYLSSQALEVTCSATGVTADKLSAMSDHSGVLQLTHAAINY